MHGTILIFIKNSLIMAYCHTENEKVLLRDLMNSILASWKKFVIWLEFEAVLLPIKLNHQKSIES